MRELRAMTDRIRTVFEAAGYGEVYTPALEYEATFAHGDTSAARPAYRVFDEHGHVLALRSDMTIPIARVVASRYPHAEPPLRFCYFAHAYRGVRPQRGQSRELLQAGVELIGSPAPEGTAEALTVLLAAMGVAADQRERILGRLVVGDFVELERIVMSIGLAPADAELLLRVPRMRGGPEVLNDLSVPLETAAAGMRSLHALLEPSVAERIIFDLGLVRSLGYYTGAVFQVYDPAYGVVIGSGGRYDDLLASFGRPLPAVGFALNVERLHIALAGEERGTGAGGHEGAEGGTP
jgi:ATP phosphoribosyltransferase regulatory subunit